MPRNSSGNYVLPTGNPVVADTLIESAWANSTLEDVAEALTDSLDRNGRGGMLAPFRLADGAAMEPGLSFANEPSAGLYRAGANDVRMTILGVPRMRWTAAGGTEYWNGAAWKNLTEVLGGTTGLGTAAYANLTTSLTDGTVGSVARIGDFGLGSAGADPVDSNLNTVHQSGFYRLTASTTNAYPGQQSGDSLMVASWASAFVGQLGFNRSGSVWSRYNDNGTWRAWRQLDAIPAGTRMLFQQTAAPTGWVRDTAAAMNNRALRLVTGTVGSGGSVAFTTAFGSARATTSSGAHSHTITVNNRTLTAAQMPVHSHLSGAASEFTAPVSWGENSGTNRPAASGSVLAGSGTQGSRRSARSDNTGSGSAHNHTASSNSTGAHTHTSNLDVQYVDLLVATKS